MKLTAEQLNRTEEQIKKDCAVIYDTFLSEIIYIGNNRGRFPIKFFFFFKLKRNARVKTCGRTSRNKRPFIPKSKAQNRPHLEVTQRQRLKSRSAFFHEVLRHCFQTDSAETEVGLIKKATES